VIDPLADPREDIRRVYAYVAYRVGHGSDAEDITSDTFERAIRYRQSFDPRRGSRTAWLVGIARRCIADWRESQTPIAPAPGLGVAESHEMASVQSLHLAAAVAELAERDREILALRFGADLSARDIAQALSLRTNTVEVALHRALSRLRDLLSSEVLSNDSDSRHPVAAPRTSSDVA
jgi:RNA polymerase sigma factor (sigma-70 family)